MIFDSITCQKIMNWISTGSIRYKARPFFFVASGSSEEALTEFGDGTKTTSVISSLRLKF